jgi:hypothetical protein
MQKEAGRKDHPAEILSGRERQEKAAPGSPSARGFPLQALPQLPGRLYGVK